MRKQKKQIIATLLMIMVLLCGCGNSKTNEEEQKPNESESIQVSAKQDTENLKTESDSASNKEKEGTKQSAIPDYIPESATNGMWVDSYVDIQQKDGKYETRIYLDSVDATDAEFIYFTASVAMTVLDRNVESDFYIVISDNKYKLNMDSKEFSDIGFPKEWTEFLKDSDDEGKTLLESISVSFSNSLDSWTKYSFSKYLDNAIIVEEESKTEEQEEAETIEEKETEEEWETLARKTYSYDDGSETTFLFSKDKENKFHLTISLNIDEKWKAAYAFTILCNTIQIDVLKEVNAVVILQCGDDTLTSSGLSVDSSGNLIKNSEWLTEGMTSEEFDSKAAESLLDDIKDSFSDFIANEMGKYLS